MTMKKYSLTIFSLTMITVGSVDSLRNLPATALFGSELVFFFTLGALFFLLPTALVSAELASAWPKQGGIYIWVKEAFGKPMGFLAIWLQWIENVIWYPTILSFVGGTIAYLINPLLAENPYFLWGVIVAAFWGATFLNLRGMSSSASFSTLCTLFGLLLPMTLIIGLGVVWIADGNPMQVQLTAQRLIPHVHDSGLWVSLTAIMLSFCGVEIATVHANDIENPQRAFPRALIYSVLIILSTLILGSLAIAVVLPQADINLVAGIMQAFDAFFARYDLNWMIPLVALMLILGGLGGVSNWIIAPTKGLLVAAEDGNLPAYFSRTNQQGAPIVMLIGQAVIVTVLSTLFLFMPSVNGSYWLLTGMAAQLYMLMYLLMFAAAIKLRVTAPKVQGLFRIPGGMLGLATVACIGMVGSAVTFGVSFMPPNGIDVGNVAHYEMILLSALALLCAPPFVAGWWQGQQLKKKHRLITESSAP